ncbi:MAG: hypothetical protein COV10_01365 [Candidatus Vogelbacteria bacterium CG10_big_fil_rev_8_21_14_0_10_51_16]|uniref:DUF192 domain-containing protein n=1 Tax=Candidatus Vogelbacteria bacterium CG10_big_fil_rev_8_21_14_0_10_51_16 TaxID=1975045 RepID=A0A2H0RF33_9BACT|nr:MAG: hypothetical protein COV10_01365 [Candidatus Vogelbacteria bacterium CG10_big_fil_rev_8_21_14_0_10_51_16]
MKFFTQATKYATPVFVTALTALIILTLFLRDRPKPDNREYFRETATVVVAETTITAKIAETAEEQELGLGGVRELADDEGMLFVFWDELPQAFWNKGMLMSFDLLWVRHGIVTGVESNIQKEKEGVRTVYSPEPITHVLELGAGWARRHGVKEGDKIVITRL